MFRFFKHTRTEPTGVRHLSLALCSRFYRSIDISDKKSLLRKRIDKAFRQELRISVFDSHYADAQIPCQIPFGRELLFGKDVPAYDILFDALVKVMVEAVCTRLRHIITKHHLTLFYLYIWY